MRNLKARIERLEARRAEKTAAWIVTPKGETLEELERQFQRIVGVLGYDPTQENAPDEVRMLPHTPRSDRWIREASTEELIAEFQRLHHMAKTLETTGH